MPGILDILGASGTALSGFGQAISAFQSGSDGISWGDINKNLAYQKELLRFRRGYDKRVRRDLFAYRRRLKMSDARQFGTLAEKMGVSRYALLGNSGLGTVQAVQSGGAPLTVTRRGQKGSPGAALQAIGQSIKRGIEVSEHLKNAESQRKVDDAQARLLNAKADDLVNQSQMPQDLDPWQVKYEKSIVEKGGQIETLPTLSQGGIIRQYPAKEAQDFVSESTVGATLFWKGRLQYAARMSRGKKIEGSRRKDRYSNSDARAYHRERGKMSHIFGEVYWDPTVINKPSPGILRFFPQAEIVLGAWRVKNY